MVRNAKAKIRRTKKNYGIDLAEEIQIPKLTDFETRSQYNEWKEGIQEFTNRYNIEYQFVKNEYDVVASKGQLKRIEKNTKIAQEKAKQMIDKLEQLPVYQQGEQTMTVAGRILMTSEKSATGIKVPLDFDFSSVRTQDVLRAKEKGMEKQASEDYYQNKQDQYKDNFIKKMEGSFNSDADYVVDVIKNMSDNDFYEMTLMYPDTFDFDLYGSDQDEEVLGLLRNVETDMEDYFRRGRENKIKVGK